jgi:hypothetical protein
MSARLMSLLFLFVILVTFASCQNPGRFQTGSTWLQGDEATGTIRAPPPLRLRRRL